MSILKPPYILKVVSTKLKEIYVQTSGSIGTQAQAFESISWYTIPFLCTAHKDDFDRELMKI